MTSLGVSRADLDDVDLLVIGAGIVGLAHAYDAVTRGLSVAVIDRDEHAVGASVRNFGHGCFTAQSGDALRYAMNARPSWIRLAKEAGFWLTATGTVVVARAADEYAVLQDFCDARGEQAVLLDADEVADRVPVAASVLGGAWLPLDIRVNPREAVASIAKWLKNQGVRFYWQTAAQLVEPGFTRTTLGSIRSRWTVAALGHDVDWLFPDLARTHGMTRCALQMLRVRNPARRRIDPAVLTGLSLLRYTGFALSPHVERVRMRVQAAMPGAIAAGLNLMFTQCPNGDLIVGDTHSYAETAEPFSAEELDELILSEIAILLEVEQLGVRERWRGVYASAPEPFLVAAPAAEIRVVSVTSGIGMTTAFGLAPEVLDSLLN